MEKEEEMDTETTLKCPMCGRKEGSEYRHKSHFPCFLCWKALLDAGTSLQHDRTRYFPIPFKDLELD
jgi:hypothetical protein